MSHGGGGDWSENVTYNLNGPILKMCNICQYVLYCHILYKEKGKKKVNENKYEIFRGNDAKYNVPVGWTNLFGLHQ